MLKTIHLEKTDLTLALFAILPFWVFAGFSETMTVNGEVISDTSLNILGVFAGVLIGWYGITQISAIASDRRKPADERSIDMRKHSIARLPGMVVLLGLAVVQLLVSSGMV